MNRKFLKISKFVVVAMCMVSIFLAACGKDNTKQSASQKAYEVTSEESVHSEDAKVEDPYAEIKASREEIITIGSLGLKKWVQGPADAFNQAQDKYWVEVKQYESLEGILLDISRMQGPDIFYLWYINADMMAQKGVLEDLTPYFESSEEVSKEKIVPAIWRAGSVGKGEYFVIPRFFSQFYLVEKGYTDNGVWTPGEFFALAEKYPEGMLHEYIKSPRDMLYNALDGSLDSYVNWEEKECSFDSESFKGMLKGLKYYSEKVYEEFDSENMAEQLQKKLLLTKTINLYGKNYMTGYKDVKAVLDFCEIAAMPNEEEQLMYSLCYEQIYGMNAGSEKKEAAWAFLEFLYSREYQESVTDSYFSARQDILEEMLSAEVGRIFEIPYRHTNQLTREKEMESGMSNFTEEDKQQVLEIIENSYRVEVMGAYEIKQIIVEEADYYFAGDKGLDEVADIIQNRVGLFLME